MLIHRNVIRSLAPATTTGNTRYPLQGIYIDPENGECIATDGAILVRAAAASTDPDSEYPTNIAGATIDPTQPVTGLIDATVLEKAAKGLTKRQQVPILANVVITQNAQGQTEVITTDLDQVTRMHAPALDGTFPPWRKVFTVLKDANTVTLGAALLQTLAKVANAQGCRTASVTFHIVPDQANSGVYFTVGTGTDSPKVDGVVMPMRV